MGKSTGITTENERILAAWPPRLRGGGDTERDGARLQRKRRIAQIKATVLACSKTLRRVDGERKTGISKYSLTRFTIICETKWRVLGEERYRCNL